MNAIWTCPRCTTRARSVRPVPAPMHPCRGLAGLSVPMLPEGVRADVRPVEREDYIGGDLVQTDGEGRPVMAVVTTRDDGQDCTVYAPTATTGMGV